MNTKYFIRVKHRPDPEIGAYYTFDNFDCTAYETEREARAAAEKIMASLPGQFPYAEVVQAQTVAIVTNMDAPATHLDIDQFRATKVWYDNLTDCPTLDLGYEAEESGPGYVYLGILFIEKVDNGWEAPLGSNWDEVFTEDLYIAEDALYEYADAEGYLI